LRGRPALAMVPAMTTWWVRAAALAAAAAALQACQAGPEKQATASVQALLAAVQSGNNQAFEALLDRPALRTDLRKQIAPIARENEVLVDGGPSDLALDNMISPEAFRLVQAGSGAPLAATPSADQVQALLKRIDATRVCIHDLTPKQGCVATFAKEAPGWRMIGMLAGGVTVAVPPEPQKK
jgi:hypothetical protein